MKTAISHAPSFRLALGLPAAAALLALAACSSAPPIQYHTLMPPPASEPAAAPSSGIVLRIDDPVRVPAQVDQPQLVVRTPQGDVQVLEQQRWVAPLADEWRDAVADRLVRRLGALDVSRVGSEGAQPWRVQLELQRFDSTPGEGAAEDAAWSLRRPGESLPALTCHSSLKAPAGTDPPALAAAHRELTGQLGDAIAAAVKALKAGQTPTCG